MRRAITAGLFLAFSTAGLWAQVLKPADINDSNVYKMGGSMTEYIAPDEPSEKAPKGFKPFYISTYARHGSRYLLDAPQYHQPYDILKAAQDKGVLTDFGKTVLDRVEIMMNDAEGRLGDVTQKGMRQHRGIAHRMVESYPEIFSGKGRIEARSTTVPRVILSMMSGVSEIARMRPGLEIKYDGSGVDSQYLTHWDNEINSFRNGRERSQAHSALCAKLTHPERLMTALFKDTTFITRYESRVETRMFPMMGMGGPVPGSASQNATVMIQDMSSTLYTKLYDLAANMQSHDLGIDLNDVFTYQEWYDMFLTNNAYWYSVSAFTPVTGSVVPYGVSTLLQNILDQADAAIAGNGVSANLRYGHDTYLYPLVCLMQINDCAWEVEDFEHIADKWVAYDIVAMASNLQLVFYRDRQGTLLVKPRLNEKDASLPFDCYTDAKGREYPHYYRWDKFRSYYMNVLQEWETKRKELN